MSILPKNVVQELGVYQSPPEGRTPFVRLDLNENTVGFPPSTNKIDEAFPFNMYPEYGEITRAFAEMFGVAPGNIILTNGSDEALSVVAQTFVEPGVDTALVSDPTFFMIPHFLKIAGAKLKSIPLRSDMTFDEAAIENGLSSGVKLAVFATPDNPTGAILNPEHILNWCKQFPNILFIIDEAYAEYSGLSLTDRALEHENLLVIRSLSKAWGLAGLRLGIVLGQEKLINYLKIVRPPYSVNAAAVSAARQMVGKRDEVMLQAKETMHRKAGVVSALKARGYKLVEGAGNFILLGVGFNSKEFSQYLRQRGILVRDRSQGAAPGEHALWGFVRIAIGTAGENQRLLNAIDEFNAQYAVSFDLDGTLVDTTDSFDRTVDLLVTKFSGKGLLIGELASLRAEGGFNNNWDAAEEILLRRGVKVERQELEKAALEFYFELAKTKEKLMIELALLSTLRKRHPVFIVTGRSRMEYDPLWGQTFDQICNKVYCVDDVPQAKPKPAPDHLTAMLNHNNLGTGVYVGNSVDDMRAALSAGMTAIAVTSTLSADQLRAAGAHLILKSPDQLDKVFLV